MASDIKGCRQYPQEAGTCLKGWRGWYSVEPLWKTTPMTGHPFFMTFFFLLKTLKPPDPFYWVTLKRAVTLYRKKQTNEYMAGSRVWHTGVKTGTYYREKNKTDQPKHDRKHRVWHKGMKTGRKEWRQEERPTKNMAGNTEFDTQEWKHKERPTKTWQEAQSLTHMNEDRKKGMKTWSTEFDTQEWRQEERNEDRKHRVWKTWMKTGRKTTKTWQEAQSLTHMNEDRKKGMKTGSTKFDTQGWRQEERPTKTWQEDRVWHTEMKTGRKIKQNMAGWQSLTHRVKTGIYFQLTVQKDKNEVR